MQNCTLINAKSWYACKKFWVLDRGSNQQHIFLKESLVACKFPKGKLPEMSLKYQLSHCEKRFLTGSFIYIYKIPIFFHIVWWNSNWKLTRLWLDKFWRKNHEQLISPSVGMIFELPEISLVTVLNHAHNSLSVFTKIPG